MWTLSFCYFLFKVLFLISVGGRSQNQCQVLLRSAPLGLSSRSSTFSWKMKAHMNVRLRTTEERINTRQEFMFKVDMLFPFLYIASVSYLQPFHYLKGEYIMNNSLKTVTYSTLYKKISILCLIKSQIWLILLPSYQHQWIVGVSLIIFRKYC